MITEIAYNGRDNRVDLQLLADDVAIDGSMVTRTQLVAESSSGSTTLDSSTAPAAFDWSAGNGVVSLDLSSLAAGRYSARLIVYDGSHPNGLVWGDPFALVVEAV